MMRVRIVCVGKKHDPLIASAIDNYSARVLRVMALEWEYVAPSGLPEARARIEESKRLLSRLKGSESVWLLDERGIQLSSEELADKFEQFKNTGTERLTFVIGGAYGVDDSIRRKADFTWSLSRLVFPHQLVRLILAEQLYRATEISRGSDYHHK